MNGPVAARMRRSQPNVVVVHRPNVVLRRQSVVVHRLNVAMRRLRLNVELVHPRTAGGVDVIYREQQRPRANSRATIAVSQRRGQNARFGRSNSDHRQNV
jgi:hypothetical protein